MKAVFNVAFYNGDTRIARAENIDAEDKVAAVPAAIQAIAKRQGYMKKSKDARTMIEDLHRHLQYPGLYPKPYGLGVFVARVDLGEQVI